ncbi:NAD(P)H-dependent oxidoreductase [Saccharothrix obliqua]|uniref:NAD(P)H-dependent oxidoreductase n=1 Tax=Saccharothrix obliqua TaxID=2861747 RepID=UPI001C5D2183|nr:NAD(P)H-dependent oxidoreductase [Saccharothrix obliqua]MBW4722361.1 NAD(P)H-dependent oxidoreductase [Saccharothrix obliqua]
MPREKTTLTLLLAGAGDGRAGWAVAEWLAGWAEVRSDVDARLVDLADHPPPRGPARSPVTRDALPTRLAEADAVVVVTADHHGGMTAELKNAVERSADRWAGKPVGFVSYGGGHAVACLGQVMRGVDAVVAGAVEVTGATSEALAGHVEAVSALMDVLAWWGRELRWARTGTTQTVKGCA